jgi:hypothetical protein
MVGFLAAVECADDGENRCIQPRAAPASWSCD